MINIGYAIKKQRKILKMSQSELAMKLGVTKGFMSKVENGVAPLNIKRLFEIGEILNYDFFRDFEQERFSDKWRHVIDFFEEKGLTPEEVIDLIETIDIIKRKF